MKKYRYAAGGIAVAVGLLPVIGVSPALAATYEFVSPATIADDDALWYTGGTYDIEWTVDAETGAYTLELWSSGVTPARIATIGSGTDITVGTHSWTIPTSIPALVAEDVTIRLDPATGDTIESDPFDLRRHGVTGVEFREDDAPYTSVVAGRQYEATWSSGGLTGGSVVIDLVRTVDGKSKVTNLLKSTPDDGAQTVTIPAKQPVDTAAGAATYQLRVTPVGAGAVADASDDAFKVLAPALTVTSQETAASVALGNPVEITWTNTGPNAKGTVVAKPATGKPVTVAVDVESGYDWYPTATGVYDVIVTDTKDKKLSDTSTAKVTVTASTEVVVQEVPSDATVTNGQEIVLSWGAFDDADDVDVNDTALPVDINLVDGAGKVTKLAQSVIGELDGGLRTFAWTPSAKVKPGTYTVKVSRTGSTVSSDQSITVAAPTALTVSNTATSVEPGALLLVEWALSDSAVLPVNIDLVPASGKPVSLGKKVLGTAGVEGAQIPATTAAGSYKVRVSTVDRFGSTPAVLSDDVDVTVVAPTLTVTATASVTNGNVMEITWEYGDDSAAPVKLELFKGSATKPTVVISKSDLSDNVGTGTFEWRVPGKLAAGTDYKVRATMIGPKVSPATDDSAAVAVSAPTLTVDDLAGPVTIGQTVDLGWNTSDIENLPVTVSLVKGDKVVARLDSKELTVNGDGSYSWLVSSRLVAGTDYEVRVTSNDIATVTDDSAVFTVRANTTTAG